MQIGTAFPEGSLTGCIRSLKYFYLFTQDFHLWEFCPKETSGRYIEELEE